MKRFPTKYGYFDDEANEYVILTPDTPRPWVNVICPGDYGLVISQTGGGYSWKTHASLNRITRWCQDIVRDDWGKYIYVRDEGSGDVWSLTWMPVRAEPEYYRVAHGIGYSRITSKNAGIRSELSIFVPPGEPLEIWLVELGNETSAPRNLSLFTYLEWCLGVGPDIHREFHRTFIETGFDPELGVMWATKRLWEIPSSKSEPWNRSWEYVAFHSTSLPPSGYEGDKEAFLGRYGSFQDPEAVRRGSLAGVVGKWGDAVASLHTRVTLEPGETQSFAYVLGAVEREAGADTRSLVVRYKDLVAVRDALSRTKAFWRDLLSPMAVDTPDPAFNLLTNVWLKYQAISGRLWGRTGYYQSGGAYGFRDQLQDSQVFLPLDPGRTKDQIKLHASHQFQDGHVNHWWHPLSEVGAENRVSDNLLWLPFVTVNYLKETLDFAFLDEMVPYRDGGSGSVYEHCLRAIQYSLVRRSCRGIPLIGGGDWNDGMNAVGGGGAGESIWLGHFLHWVLNEFAVVAGRKWDEDTARRYEGAARELKEAINAHGWDGEWYIRATCDDGTLLGSSKSKYGRIFLNAQTWAVMSGVADDSRVRAAMDAVKRHLSLACGPVLLAPAYQEPDEKIGYLTRYAPGVRENGGRYTHASCWAILAAAMMRDAQEAWRMYRNICPIHCGENPDLYKVEPYVTAGNADGPDSPNMGEGGWTWYTGSAAWLFRVCTDWLLGVRAEYDGLLVDPCIPPEWDGFTVRRTFRGAIYQIIVRNPDHVASGVSKVAVDGIPGRSNLLPPVGDGRVHDVEIILGRDQSQRG